jgi:hypothetical protein
MMRKAENVYKRRAGPEQRSPPAKGRRGDVKDGYISGRSGDGTLHPQFDRHRSGSKKK